MHYFLIAGEPSGDLHGADLITQLRKADPAAIFSFIGGDRMAQAAGCPPLVHNRELAVMGFAEVIRNIFTLGAHLSRAKEAVVAAAPDAFIAIDYPSFNIDVAAAAHDAGIPVYWYISPKVWAWKKWRLRDLRRYCRHVFSILPFEPEFFRRNNAECIYVGNPSVAEIDRLLRDAPADSEFRSRYGLDSRPVVALMPGSRKGEIADNLPVMLRALSCFPDWQPVIIGSHNIDDAVYDACGRGAVPLLRPAYATEVLAHSVAAVVTSGTATLETALCRVPQVVVYRSNGSRLAYKIMEFLLDVRYVSLPNLISSAPVVPELLLHNCTVESVAHTLVPLLKDTAARRAQLEGYENIRTILGTEDPAATAAAIITRELR